MNQTMLMEAGGSFQQKRMCSSDSLIEMCPFETQCDTATSPSDPSHDCKIKFKEDSDLMVDLLQGALKLPPNTSPASTVCELQQRLRQYDETISSLSQKATDFDALFEAVKEITLSSRGRSVNDVIDRLRVMWKRQEKIKTYMKRRLDNAEEQLKCSRTLVTKLEAKLRNTGEKETQLISHLEKMQDKITSVSEGMTERPCGDVSERIMFRKEFVDLKQKCQRLERELAATKGNQSEITQTECEPISEQAGVDYQGVAVVTPKPFARIRDRIIKKASNKKNNKLNADINCSVQIDRGTQTDLTSTEDDTQRNFDEYKRRTKDEIASLRFDRDDNKDMVERLRKVLTSFHKSVVVNNGPIQVSPVSIVDQAVLVLFLKTHIKRLELATLEPWAKNTANTEDDIVIGKGAFGKVTLMRYVPTNMPVAFKVQERRERHAMMSDDEATNKLISRSMKEAVMHCVMSDNPSFPAMHGVAKHEDCLGMVLGFIGDKAHASTYPLCEVLSGAPPRLRKLAWIDIALDIVSGIAALHEKGLLHNDLKSNNILLQLYGGRWRAYIIDFGHGSTIVMPLQFPAFSVQEEHEYCEGFLYQHLAPEIVRDLRPTSVHSDVYSLGVVLRDIARVCRDHDMNILAEMCTRSKPYRRPIMPNVELSVIRSKQKAQQCI